MLLFPEEAQRLKYNPSPVSEYDYSTNLAIMKKVPASPPRYSPGDAGP